MKQFRLTIEIYVRVFERGIFHVLIHAERGQKKVVKKIKQ